MDSEQIRQEVERRRRETEKRLKESMPEPGDPKSNGRPDSKFVRQCLFANQLGDGLLYSAFHRGQYIYNKSSGRWLRWTGHYWERDTRETALSAVETVAQRYFEEAGKLVQEIDWAIKKKDVDLADKLQNMQKSIYKRVTRLREEAGRAKCLSFSHTNPIDSLDIVGEQLDQNPWFLGCANGVIDLRTGEMRPGIPEDYITKVSPIEWQGIHAPAPQWEKALDDIFEGNTRIIEYIQRFFGYACTGFNTEHVLFIFCGQGRNGKGTLLELISKILGDLAGPIQAEMLLDQSRSRNPAGPSPDIMGLRGLRLAWASETEQNRRFSTARVKWLTGGDTLIGRAPHEPVDTRFEPTHTLILLTNHQPEVPVNDFAFWSRVHLIPFTVSFVDYPPVREYERPADKDLKEKLLKEAPGILAWLVRGSIRWQEIGLSPPDEIKKATAEYQREEDWIADFIETKCKVGPDEEALASELYDEFKGWYSENVSKKNILSQKRFGKLLRGRFRKEKKGIVRYYGLRLLSSF